ncbi:hypothetical protein GGI07_004141 [Coemansia sp. Benny D115]|nr:hypothetical protein GGI07_004141 [Coemansia sp. Benny D115]
MHLLSRLSLLSLTAAASAVAQKKQQQPMLRGLDPQLAQHYIPGDQNIFRCLDGSKSIPFSQVNDDYCDCPDGSDEPGTSACNNGSFYCANTGHLPARIPSTRVNDGVCDPDCCDGSDEWESPGLCANVCLEVGAKYRALMDARLNAEAAGSTRRAELVAQAQAMRNEKLQTLAEQRSELEKLEERLLAAEQEKERLEALQKEHQERASKSVEGRKKALHDEYLADLVTYRKHLAAELHYLRAHRDSLLLLLRSVKVSHNPEFNDQAVAKAIESYAAFVDEHPYIEAAALEYADEDADARALRESAMDRDNEAQDDVSYDACRSAIDVAESERQTAVEDVALLFAIIDDLRRGYNKNYHDLAVKAAVVGLGEHEATHEKDISDIEARAENVGIASVRQRVDDAKARLAEIVAESDSENSSGDPQPSAADAPQLDSDADLDQLVADARSAAWDLLSEKNSLKSKVTNLQELLEKDLGPQDVYLPVSDQCYSLDTGEYTYEVCLLDRASQISNKDGSRQSLGSFSAFGDLSATNKDYSVHRYLQGTKCWNGPHRSLTASFECADQITVLSVSEPEKCEYHAKMTGPFACPDVTLPPADKENENENENLNQLPPMSDVLEENNQQAGGNNRPHDEL